jgi:hypothetical protein
MSALRALRPRPQQLCQVWDIERYVYDGRIRVSAKSNQHAYLFPDSCLTGGMTNPYQYPRARIPAMHSFRQSAPELEIMNDKTLADYGIVSTTNNIKYIPKQSDQRILHLFLP